ncbi:MAG: cell division ATP-binding protein FtsE [Alphaproteobacteria bacterium]|nr:cell division ATP-binding protein FtsE [Alphaproteobacteria bacterium]NCB49685.1 cell division ATP-binding protein FtsE [Alphaproteobacteria bacterium]
MTLSIFKNQKNAPIVTFEGVGLRYSEGPEVLRDIDFSLEPGSIHFLTGESGAGKTSLLSLMYLDNRPTRGKVRLFGNPVEKTERKYLPFIRRKIGVVFQDFRLLNHLSTFDNVALPLRIAGVKESEIRKHVGELIKWVGLSAQINAKVTTLSGGQKQRVAIARAVINRPALLLADEPTGNVDDELAKRLLHLFIELNKLGTTVLIATHSEPLIHHFGFERLHLEHGRLTHLPALGNSLSPKNFKTKKEAENV